MDMTLDAPEDTLRPQDRDAKIAGLRATIAAAVLRGGSHSDEDVARAVSARLGDLSLTDAAE